MAWSNVQVCKLNCFQLLGHMWRFFLFWQISHHPYSLRKPRESMCVISRTLLYRFSYFLTLCLFSIHSLSLSGSLSLTLFLTLPLICSSWFFATNITGLSFQRLYGLAVCAMVSFLDSVGRVPMYCRDVTGRQLIWFWKRICFLIHIQ